VVRNSDDPINAMSVMLAIKMNMTAQFDMKPVCKIIDPYVEGFLALHEGKTTINELDVVSAINGIHIAFWIYDDSLNRLPTDPVVFSGLMDRIFGVIFKTEDELKELKREILPMLEDNEDLIAWQLNLLHLRSVNFSLTFLCTWTLLILCQLFHEQDVVRAEINAKRFSS